MYGILWWCCLSMLRVEYKDKLVIRFVKRKTASNPAKILYELLSTRHEQVLVFHMSALFCTLNKF